MTNTSTLRRMIAIIGLFLIAISLYCSFLLYTSFSTQLSDKAAWGGMGLVLDLFKNIALLAALALWSLQMFTARALSVVVALAYLVLTALSFMAFFGFMASVQNKLETAAVLQSTQYQSLKTSVENAARKVEDLSRYADSSVIEEARAKLQAIEAREKSVLSGMSAYAHSDCTPKTDHKGRPYKTLAARWCSQLQAVQAEAAPWQAAIAKHQHYQSAVAHHEKMLADLAALNSGEVAVGNSHLHPMFVDLGKLLRAAPDEMKVAFMFISSATAEVLGTLSILIASLLGHKRSFTLDEIEVMSSQLHEQRARLSQALGLDLLPAPSAMPPALRQAQEAGATTATTPPSKYDAAAQPPIKTQSEPIKSAPGKHQQEALEIPLQERLKLAQGMAFQASKGSHYRANYGAKSDWDKPIRAHSADLNTQYKNIMEAILQNHCAPQVKALQRHFKLDPREAQVCLEVLSDEGYLEKKGNKYMLRHSIHPGDSLCHGISYREADDNIHAFFTENQATLPVKMRQGQCSQMPWGRKAEDPGSLPYGGWASLESIHAGRWEAFSPRPVQIAATGHVQQDKDGENHYFELQENQILQGLMAQDREQQVIYLVTVQTPKELQYVSSRWPRII